MKREGRREGSKEDGESDKPARSLKERIKGYNKK